MDTSIWIDHLRSGNQQLVDLLESAEVMVHPFVIGELACGNLGRRTEILRLLGALPHAAGATDGEVMAMVTERRLYGAGIGWVDAHLLASALLTHVPLWTQDRALHTVAVKLEVSS